MKTREQIVEKTQYSGRISGSGFEFDTIGAKNGNAVDIQAPYATAIAPTGIDSMDSDDQHLMTIA